MLARFLWPMQSACRRHPLAANGICALAAGAAAHAAWGHGIGRDELIALAASTTLGLAVARGALVGLAVPGTAAAGGAVCAVAGDAGASLPVIAVATAMLLPMAHGIARARAPEAMTAAIAHGTAFIGFFAQLAIAGVLASGSAAPRGILAAALLGLAWPAAASAARRLSPAAHADQPRAIPPEPATPGRDRIIARAALLVLAIPAWWIDWRVPREVAIGLGLLALAWILTLGRPLVGAAMIAWGLGVCSVCQANVEDARSLAAFAAGQALPLLAWWARAHGQRPTLLLATAIALALVIPLSLLGLSAPALVGGMTGWIVLLAAEPGALRPGAPLRRARRAAGGLAPYWRHYLRAKLAFDPLYRRLAEDAAPWGRVLDAGCGPGLVAALAASRPDAGAYCGIDLDEEKLVVARRVLDRCARPLNDRWQLLRGSLPFPQPLPRRFDTVFLLDVLHYWPPERQAALLGQLRGALDAGGRLWLREGIAADDGDAGRVALGERFTTRFGLNPGTGQLSFPTRAGIEALLTTSGFRVEDCEESGAENRLFRCAAV